VAGEVPSFDQDHGSFVRELDGAGRGARWSERGVIPC
jgi:hypothetical protein